MFAATIYMGTDINIYIWIWFGYMKVDIVVSETGRKHFHLHSEWIAGHGIKPFPKKKVNASGPETEKRTKNHKN